MCRFDGQYRKGASQRPHPVLFINETSLAIFDDMFYRLPFPSASQLEQVLKKNPVIQARNAEYLASRRVELGEERAKQDFASGWKAYLLKRSLEVSAPAAKIVYASWQDRNRSPSPVPDTAG